LESFTHAPGSSKEPIKIGSQHRARVVKCEDGIKAQLFKLTQSKARRPSTFRRFVTGMGKVAK
jgi:hypothetical protein